MIVKKIFYNVGYREIGYGGECLSEHFEREFERD